MTNSEVTKIWINNFQEYCKNKPEIFEYVLDLAIEGRIEEGRKYLQTNLPFKPHTKNDQKYYSSWQKLNVKNTHFKSNKSNLKSKDIEKIYIRDFYQCRYTGLKLLSLEAINLLKTLYYVEFPFPNYNGNYLITHIDIWTFYPQVDHIIPLKSPKNDWINNEKNLATISCTFNIHYKSSLSLSDIGIDLTSLENLDSKWDGLISKTNKFKTENKNLYNSLKNEAHVHYEERLAWAKNQKNNL